MFHVGQKVVYVGGGCRVLNQRFPKIMPHKGGVYTVRGIEGAYIPYYECCGLLLCEISFAMEIWNGRPFEPCILADKFRPVIERKTDISIFTRMLDGVREMAN